MPRMMIIPENLMAFPGSTASAGSEASASMAAVNLLTEDPSEFWRSTSVLQGKSWFKVGNTNLDLLIADSFALIHHNLVRGSVSNRKFRNGGYGHARAGIHLLQSEWDCRDSLFKHCGYGELSPSC